jgi:hypothetical protein
MKYFTALALGVALSGPARAGAPVHLYLDGERTELHHDLLRQNGVLSVDILRLAHQMGVRQQHFIEVARHYSTDSDLWVLLTKKKILLAPVQVPFVTGMFPPAAAQNGTTHLKLLYLRDRAMQQLQDWLGKSRWVEGYTGCDRAFKYEPHGTLGVIINSFEPFDTETRHRAESDAWVGASVSPRRLMDLQPGHKAILITDRNGRIASYATTITEVSESELVATGQRGEGWAYDRTTGKSVKGGPWRLFVPPGAPIP